MTVIMKDRYYVRIENGIPTLTTDINKATVYSPNSADNYINTNIRKEVREQYKAVQLSSADRTTPKRTTPHALPALSMPPQSYRDISSDISRITDELQSEYSRVLNMLAEKLSYCDRVILDIRHYIRDENTKLNACQGYKVFKMLQEIERERLSVKTEIAKINEALTNMQQTDSKVRNFTFPPYNPRAVQDIGAYFR